MFIDLAQNQLFSIGCHIGHSKSNSLFYSSWLIVAFRQTTSILNLFRTVLSFRSAFLVLSNVVSYNGPIWFVTSNKMIDRYAKYSALNCGEFSITSTWIRGAISNYPSVFFAYRRLFNLPGLALSKKKRNWLLTYSNWTFSRFSWPRAVFLSSLKTSYFPAKEALSLGIPCISIIDTDVHSQSTSLAIPGNDESLLCLVFYNTLLCTFVLSRKFGAISSWFSNTRAWSRVLDFLDWVSGKYSKNINLDFLNAINFRPKNFDGYFKSMTLFFSFNFWSNSFKENLDVFYKHNDYFDYSSSFFTFLLKKHKYFVFLNLNFLKTFSYFRGFYKKRVLNDNKFKSKFLTKNFFKKFYNLKYLSGRLNSFFDDNNNFLKSIVHFYFVLKFSKKKVIRSFFISRFNYWFFLGTLLGVNRTRLFFNTIIKKHKDNNLNLIDTHLLNLELNSNVFYISNFFLKKLKFVINNAVFSLQPSKIYWDSNYFSPSDYNSFIYGLFFNISFDSNSISVFNSFFFKDRFRSVFKRYFSLTNNWKFIWF